MFISDVKKTTMFQEHQAQIARATKTAVIFICIGFLLLIPGPYFLVKSLTTEYNPYSGDSNMNGIYMNTGISCIVVSVLIILVGMGICCWICKNTEKSRTRQRQRSQGAMEERGDTSQPLVTSGGVMLHGYAQVSQGPCHVSPPHGPGYTIGVPHEGRYSASANTGSYTSGGHLRPSTSHSRSNSQTTVHVPTAPPPTYNEATGKSYLHCVIAQ